MISTSEIILGWFKSRERVVAAVGINTGAIVVLAVGFLGSAHVGGGSRVLVSGMSVARKVSLSAVRRTEMEEVRFDCGSVSFGRYRGWIGIITCIL